MVKPTSIDHPVRRQIIGLSLSLLAIIVMLVVVHENLSNKIIHIEKQLANQSARQDIGVSIYQRLFATKAFVLKLSMLDDIMELQIVKKRFDANLQVVKKGLAILQNGGVFEDEIATNIPGQNFMHLTVQYNKPQQEGYVLEVLELGPAIHKLDEQVQLLYKLIVSRIAADGSEQKQLEVRTQNLLKVIDAVLQRTQENAARVLYDSQQKKDTLSLQFKQAEQTHNTIRLPVLSLALCLAAYSLFITLVRVRKIKEQRRRAEDQLRLLLDTTVEGIYGVDLQGITTFVNPAAAHMLGFLPEELIGRENHTLIHHTRSDGTPYPAAECRILDVLEGGALQTVDDELFWCKDGSSFPVEYSSNPIRRDGEVVGAVVNFRNISERRHTEKQIRTLSQVVEQSPVSVILTDTNAKIEYVNSAFERATGYSATEVIGRTPSLLKSGKTPSSHYRELWQAIKNGQSWQGELQNCKKNGELFWERVHIAPVLNESGNTTHYLAVKEDITLQKQQGEQIQYQANFDSLTDLPNRFLALDRLSQLIKEAERIGSRAAVLFLDLDGFKKINDSMSHEVGDRLLVQAARRLRDVMRDGDTVSRLGGDEFVVLLGNLIDVDDAHPAAEKLLECFRKPFLLDDRELVITASIGIAIFPSDGDNPAELLRNADTAMYHSKEQGRNTYNYFTDAMNQGVSRRLQLEEQLHGALERNEFYLCYQPLVDIDSNTVVAVEALLRWNSPALGSVSPEEFIPITEQTGQIVPIGLFVLNQALALAAKWQEVHRGFRIAINISPRQFRDPNLLQQIKNALQQNKVSSESVELEITEGVLMSGHAQIDETLIALSDLGIGIAMDDFGTGYSSLSYLRSYPFGTLKIDRSFVNDITVDPADRELVNAAIAMAHGLGLKVVAEGVETKEQLAHLAAQGCEFAQGYLFSKPVSAEEITVMLERQNQGLYAPGSES